MHAECQGTLPTSSEFQAGCTSYLHWGVGIDNKHAGNEMEKTSIEDSVLKSNPILEAFGNAAWPQEFVGRCIGSDIDTSCEAKTIRNDNSSRFGKFIDIEQLGLACVLFLRLQLSTSTNKDRHHTGTSAVLTRAGLIPRGSSRVLGSPITYWRRAGLCLGSRSFLNWDPVTNKSVPIF